MIENLLQPTHLLLILVIVLIVFGPKKLPEIGKSLGQAIRGFKEAVNKATEEVNRPEEKTPASTPAIQEKETNKQ